MNSSQSSSAQPSDPDLSGHQLGDYLILRRLGAGGMAEVYLAEQQSLERQVAIKVLRPNLAAQENYVRRFHNEARAAASLVHANIVQIYEVGCLEGFHFIAQEYVRGQTVTQLVSRTGPLEITRVISILRQISAALNKAGQERIVHRDIKPENILLMPSGEAKVADFGLARVIDPTQLDLTQAGLTMGTPLYMSPEQVEGRPLDQRSDLYSCGVTSYYMLTGRPPFQGETPLSVAVQHLQTPPTPLQDFRPDVPEQLSDIVLKLLAKKPSGRYRSAAELLGDLRSLSVEGGEYHLPLEADALPETDHDERSHSLDATRQLQTLKQTQSMRQVSRRGRWLVPVTLFAALGVGCMVARLTWSGSLLAEDSRGTVQIERRDTAAAQYLHAQFMNTEEAYESVAKYHDPAESALNRYYAMRSQQRLADFYVSLYDYEAAYAAFSVLEQDSEPEFHAIGLAGQAVIHDLRDQLPQLANKISEVWGQRSLLDVGLQRDLERIVEKRDVDVSPAKGDASE